MVKDLTDLRDLFNPNAGLIYKNINFTNLLYELEQNPRGEGSSCSEPIYVYEDMSLIQKSKKP